MSKKGKLPLSQVKAPSKLVYWPPLDAVSTHRVKDGDNWWSLESQYRLPDAWDLIKYNFRTENPLEVNYYLERYLGCDTITDDEKNYVFSTSANPGVLFLPPWAVLTKGIRRVPLLIPRTPALGTYKVPGKVPVLRQPAGSNTCWAYAAAMLMSWHDKTTYTAKEALAKTAPKWEDRFDRNLDLPVETKEIDFFASACGFTYQTNACFTFSGWLAMLKKCGPVGIIIKTGKKVSHAIVLVGTEKRDQQWMLIHDPAHGEMRWEYRGFSEKYDAMAPYNDGSLLWHYGGIYG